MNQYTIVQKPALMIIGIECRTSNHPNAGPQDIPRHWQKFYKDNILNQIPGKKSDDIIALYCDYEGDYTQPYSLVLGCEAHPDENIPKELVTKIIPSSTYAVFRAIGEHPQSLIETWNSIWQSNLKRTYTGDFERYGDNFAKADPHKEIEVYIAIR